MQGDLADLAAGAVPPGPKGHFLLGSLPDFARDILGFMTSTPREYGDISHFRLPGNEIFLLQSPKDIEAVLLTRRRTSSSTRSSGST